MAGLGALGVLALFSLPGALLIRARDWRRWDAAERAAFLAIGSFVTLAIAIWMLPRGYLLAGAAALAVLGAVRLWVIRRELRPAGEAPSDRATGHRMGARGVVIAVAAVAILRLLVLLTHGAPSSVDLTMHAYMAELIRMTNGLPTSHEPLLPISTFGQNSPGLHAAAALMSMVTGMPTYRTVLAIGALALVLIPLALYRILKIYGAAQNPAPAFLAAILVTFLARNPQLFVTWGGVPTLLSFAMVLLVISDIPALLEGVDPFGAVRSGILASGAVLTHLLPVVAGLYVAGALVLLELSRSPSRRMPVVSLLSNGVLAGIAAVISCARFIRRTALLPSTDVVWWARGWIRRELDWPTFAENRLRTLLGVSTTGSGIGIGGAGLPVPSNADIGAFPFLILQSLGIAVSLVLTLWLGTWFLKSVRGGTRGHPGGDTAPLLPLLASLVTIEMLFACFAASLHEFLPLWWAFYPPRLMLYLIIPSTFALAAVLRWVGARGRSFTAAVVGIVLVLASLEGAAYLSGHEAWTRGGLLSGPWWRYVFDTRIYRVTDDDLAAFRWIERETPPDAVFYNNLGDGGELIPAAAHRMIYYPHYQFMWYEEELTRWRKQRGFDYVYVGAAPGANARLAATSERLDAQPAVFQLVHTEGKARIYRVLHGG